MCRDADPHSVCADVLVDVGPVNAVTIANQVPVRSLGGRRVRQAPRPGQGHADRSTIDQLSDNRLVGHLDVGDASFNADHSAHSKPR
jgi:hypothetical protein